MFILIHGKMAGEFFVMQKNLLNFFFFEKKKLKPPRLKSYKKNVVL